MGDKLAIGFNLIRIELNSDKKWAFQMGIGLLVIINIVVVVVGIFACLLKQDKQFDDDFWLAYQLVWPIVLPKSCEQVR